MSRCGRSPTREWPPWAWARGRGAPRALGQRRPWARGRRRGVGPWGGTPQPPSDRQHPPRSPGLSDEAPRGSHPRGDGRAGRTRPRAPRARTPPHPAHHRRSSRPHRRPWPPAPGGRVTHAAARRVCMPHGAGRGGSTGPPGAASLGRPAPLRSGPAGLHARPPV